ncbi:MAG: Flp pilus assembly complex ATPase component TadA [Candidatus Cloacimonetes bacterium]|nr:Flp pilus assembly complex ATPase component TadA [Candidatus Cloacimonadota bacterium]
MNSTIEELIEKLPKLSSQEIQDNLDQLKEQKLNPEICKFYIALLSSKEWRFRKLSANILIQNISLCFSTILKHINSKDENIRYWIIWILGYSGEMGVGPLIELYPHSSHQEKLFLLNSLKELQSPRAIPFAIENLNDDSWSIRQHSSTILIHLQSQAIDALKKTLRDGTSHQRYWSFKVLGKVLQEKALSTFSNIIFSKEYDEKTRAYALGGVKEIQSEEITPLLIKCLDSDLWPLRAQASKILIESNSEPQLPLISVLRDGTRAQKYWAGQILKEIIEEKHLSLVEEYLLKASPELKYHAITLFSKVNCDTSINSLINELSSPIWYNQKYSCDALISMGRSTIPFLIKRLSHAQEEEEIFWITKILKKLSHPSSLNALEKLLDHRSKDVRLWALEAISIIDHMSSIQILVSCFENQFWVIRSKASEYLQQYGMKSFLLLFEALSHSSESTKYWAQKTIEDSSYYGAKIIMQLIVSSKAAQRKEIFYYLNKLNFETLKGVYENPSLSRQDLVQFGLASKSQHKGTIYAETTHQASTEFSQLLNSEYSFNYENELNEILSEAINLGASQLHLKIDSHPMIRVNGMLCRCAGPKVTSDKVQAYFTPYLNEEKISIFKEKSYVTITIPGNEQTRFRAHIYRQNQGIEAVLHLESTSIPSFHDLNFPVEFFEQISRQSKGLILVSGASGSGKTLCSNSILSYINQNFVKSIVIINDQLSYSIPSHKSFISQKVVGKDVPSYEAAVEASLAEDPDVIYIAKSPDDSSLESLLHRASSKTLVILETNASSTKEAIEKLLLMFPNRQSRVYERLLQGSLISSIHIKLLNNQDQNGFVPALEYFINNSKLSSLISINSLDELIKTIQISKLDFTVCLDDYLLQLASEQKISYQEAIRWMEDKTRISVDTIW